MKTRGAGDTGDVSGDMTSETTEGSFDLRISQLETLVEELVKDDPSEEVIQTKMKELEIPYSEDPVERINRVLEALHPHQALDFEEG